MRVPALALGLPVVLCIGCAARDDAEDLPASTSSIFGGVRDDDAQAKRSVVALHIGDDELCSGALIAPNIVLTARHCVARTVSSTVACDANGLSTKKQIVADEAPSAIEIFVGASPDFSQKPSAFAKSIVTPEGDALCNADIAMVILDRPLANIEPLPVRFDAPPRSGETIRAVGYGRNDARIAIGTRFRKENVPVLTIGQVSSGSKANIGPREFEVGASVCDGDSGGPAISELTGAVIGVVSRGGPCGAASGHIYTTTAGFDDLFDRAFEAAGSARAVESNTPPETAAPAATPPPPPPAASSSSGCRAAPTPATSLSSIALGFLVAVLLRRRAGRA